MATEPVYTLHPDMITLRHTRIDDTLSSPHPMSLTLEHLTPISRGGTHNLDNIDFAHRTCNNKKGAKTLDEYRDWVKQVA